MSANKFYLTTPIYYVNARPHIGHAYTTIVADVLARRHRLLGPEFAQNTYFLTGTDEHGQKIERSAATAGIPPQQFADQVSKTFSDLWARMGITHDQFIRTTSDSHKRGVQKLFRTLYERGFIYLASYTGSYCVSDEAFIDAPVGTPCPDCGRLLEEVTEENFFFKLSAFQHQLIEEIYTNRLVVTPESSKNEVLSFLGGAAVSVAETFRPSDEKHWTISEDLDKGVEQGLLGKVHVPSAGGPARTFYYVPGALKDLSISRSSFTWGIPVPPAIQAKEKTAQPHVIYVWLDALANYMTALGYGAVNEDGTPAPTPLFDKYWPADLHLVGKEITRFHCVYWPAFLLAAGLPLPKQITAHGWLLFDNSKMSKSKGNIVRTETILDAFGTLCPPPAPPAEQPVKGTASAVPQTTLIEDGALAPEAISAEPTPHDRDLFAADVLRYYLLREIPFGQDGSFSFEALITRYNADLANGYGNLVSRTLKMIDQYFGGSVPVPQEFASRSFIFGKPSSGLMHGDRPSNLFTVYGPYLAERAAVLTLIYQQSFQDLLFTTQLDEGDPESRRAGVVDCVIKLVSETDALITEKAPWKLAKSKSEQSQDELSEVLYTAAESIRIITALLYPILPYATARVWAQLGLGDIELAARTGQLTNLTWGGLQPGTKLGPLGPIFPRAPKELAQIMIDMENPTTPAAEPTSPTHPGAAPRAIDTASTTLPVAGSSALTTGPDATPSHTEAPASGIFAAQPTPPAAEPSNSSPQIAIDDFVKIDLRVAQIVVAERIPKADKLLRLEVDLGYEKRQILSGIAEFYTPEELIGRRIVIIANLAPRKMRGLESHGMLLAASEGDHGKPVLATMAEDIALGSRLK